VVEIFRAAIQRNAAAVIILHDHPSGDPSPSPEDVALTRSIVQAGKLLDMEVTQMTNVGISFHASIRLDTLPEDDLARILFAGVKRDIEE
jgi:DNA repair protein RadC